MNITDAMKEQALQVATAYAALKTGAPEGSDERTSVERLMGTSNRAERELKDGYQQARDALWDATREANPEMFHTEPDAPLSPDAPYSTFYQRNIQKIIAVRGELDPFVSDIATEQKLAAPENGSYYHDHHYDFDARGQRKRAEAFAGR